MANRRDNLASDLHTEYHSPPSNYPSPCPSIASNSPLGSSVSSALPSSYQPSPPGHYSPSPPFYSDDPSPEPATSCCDPSKRNPSHSLVSRTRASLAHPYARIYGKKEVSKRRKIWNHALEKSLFTPHELSTMGAPHRRTIYMASLEAHIDRLHAQLLSIGYFPIAFEKLDPYRGLNSKTAKSMVAGLQHDTSHTKLKLLELERSKENLQNSLGEARHYQNLSLPVNSQCRTYHC